MGIKWWFFCLWREFNTGELELPAIIAASILKPFMWQICDQGVQHFKVMQYLFLWLARLCCIENLIFFICEASEYSNILLSTLQGFLVLQLGDHGI